MPNKQKFLPLLFVSGVLLGACTYETEIQKSEEYSNLALSPDGKRYAYLYHIMRYRQPSGVSKFPDGGVPLYLEDRVTLMLCDAKGIDTGGGPTRENNCKQSYVVQELPFKYKPGLRHMSIGHSRLRWLTQHRIAYDLRLLGLVMPDKGEIEIAQ